MRILIALTVLLATLTGIARPARALTGLTAWAQRFGSTGDDNGYSVATDASGNVFVTGSFTGTVSFGGANLVSAGELDIFIAKYNSAGVHQWSQRIGGLTGDEGKSIAVDASGNIFVTGYYTGTVNFGGGGLAASGGFEIFLAKYNTAGIHQWSQRFGSTGDDGGYSVAVDASDNVLLTGYFFGTVNFGGGNLIASVYDVIVAKYNAAGAHQWSQRFGGTGIDIGYSVDVDPSGGIVVAGQFGNTASFGGGNLVSAGGLDIFVARYDAAGVHQWSQRFGSTSTDIATSVVADASSNVLVTGYFRGTVNFGGANLVSAGQEDIFVAKYNAAGVHQWSKRFGAASSDFSYAVAADASSAIFVTGYFFGTVDFGGGGLVSAGGPEIFVAKYAPDGAHQWSRRFGSVSSEFGHALAVDPSGNLFATGRFDFTVNFGPGTLSSAGLADIFLVKLMRETAEPIISAITDIGNDQGRQVKITFDRSGYDDPAAAPPVILYEAYRRNDAPPALATTRDLAGMSSRQLLDQGWTEVGTVHGHGKNEYSIDVPTIGDSTIVEGPYNSTFFIRGATASSFTYFDSPIDSGYSVDNLAPGVPDNFVYTAGDLSWNESTAADFDYFTVYGANTDNFGVATVVDYSVAPGLDVNASPYAFYYVTATDFSGNEGKPAKVNALTGVGGTPTKYVLSVTNYPNPFNPSTTISYTVPSRGRVKVSIYDARGALVAALFDGERNAGAYSVDWDGRTPDAAGAASGVYFARIEHASGTRSKKMVLLK